MQAPHMASAVHKTVQALEHLKARAVAQTKGLAQRNEMAVRQVLPGCRQADPIDLTYLKTMLAMVWPVAVPQAA